jgi:hypothetical protein
MVIWPSDHDGLISKSRPGTRAASAVGVSGVAASDRAPAVWKYQKEPQIGPACVAGAARGDWCATRLSLAARLKSCECTREVRSRLGLIVGSNNFRTDCYLRSDNRAVHPTGLFIDE